MTAEHTMDRERCLRTLSLLMDDRPVPAELAAAARAFAEQDPECRAAWEDWQRIRDVLSTEPGLTAPAGFAVRVLAARPEADVLPFARRLAAAAALVLAVTVGYGVARPGQAVADPSVERTRHYVDLFRATPYEADDVDAGLERLLRTSDPLGSFSR
jgi:ferric-dicitrate binding protein FerR (iron transport regulator)